MISQNTSRTLFVIIVIQEQSDDIFFGLRCDMFWSPVAQKSDWKLGIGYYWEKLERDRVHSSHSESRGPSLIGWYDGVTQWEFRARIADSVRA